MRVARVRRRASATGTPRCRGSSRAWLKPRARRRPTVQGHRHRRRRRRRGPRRARRAGSAPGPRDSDRQPPYLNAWRMARSVPSYGPIARLVVTGEGRRRQRRQRPARRALTCATRAADRRSWPQSGGVKREMRVQQCWQTGPRVGCVERIRARRARRRQHDRRRRRRASARIRHPRWRRAAQALRPVRSRRTRRYLDALGVAPETLERVEIARLRREHVHDEREEIHEDPLRAIVALDVRRTHLGGAQRFFDAVGDRLHLPAVLAGAQHEEVGERGRVTQVEHDDVRCLLVERRATALRDFAGSLFRPPAAVVVVARFLVMQVICRSRAPALRGAVKPMLLGCGFRPLRVRGR